MPCPKTFVGALVLAPSSHFHAYSCAKIFIMGYVNMLVNRVGIPSIPIVQEVKMVQTPAMPENQTLSMELPSSIGLYVTQEQFAALAAVNRDLRLERNAQGELIVNPPTGWETGERNLSLTGQLDRWYEENLYLGKAFDSSTGFILPNGATRSPDASWVSQERWDALTPEQKGTFANICPDFVVELRSSSDRLESSQEKMREYIDNGMARDWAGY
jgi:Uma2 family endonuclease